MTAVTAAPTSAQPFQDRYVVFDELAVGGMASVHLARQRGPHGFGRTVVVKRLHPHLAKQPDFVKMFLDEARLAARIQHPNVVAATDVCASGSEVSLVMELVRGVTLSQLLAAGRAAGTVMPPAIASAIFAQALRGLHAAHTACDEAGEPLNVIHRDVSPQNILVGADGVTRIIDFGIARAAIQSHVTSEGTIKGKFAYMAPEQIRAEEIDHRADIFSTGVVLWEALTGGRLFGRPTQQETMLAVVSTTPAPPSELNPAVELDVDRVVLRALAGDREARYRDAEAMAADLEEAVPPATTSAVAAYVESLCSAPLLSLRERVREIERTPDRTPGLVPAADPPKPDAVDATAITTARSIASPRRRRWPAVVGLLVAGGVVGGAAAFPFAGRTGRTSSSASLPSPPAQEPAPGRPTSPSETVLPAPVEASVFASASSAASAATPSRPPTSKMFRPPVSASPRPDCRHPLEDRGDGIYRLKKGCGR